MKLFLMAAVAVAAPALAFAAPQDTTMQAAPTPTGAPTAAPATAPMADPVGGYQPATAPTPPPAGATVQFQPSADPNTAYPPPPALAHYPVCRRGQTDDCVERGSRQ